MQLESPLVSTAHMAIREAPLTALLTSQLHPALPDKAALLWDSTCSSLPERLRRDR